MTTFIIGDKRLGISLSSWPAPTPSGKRKMFWEAHLWHDGRVSGASLEGAGSKDTFASKSEAQNAMKEWMRRHPQFQADLAERERRKNPATEYQTPNPTKRHSQGRSKGASSLLLFLRSMDNKIKAGIRERNKALARADEIRASRSPEGTQARINRQNKILELEQVAKDINKEIADRRTDVATTRANFAVEAQELDKAGFGYFGQSPTSGGRLANNPTKQLRGFDDKPLSNAIFTQMWRVYDTSGKVMGWIGQRSDGSGFEAQPLDKHRQDKTFETRNKAEAYILGVGREYMGKNPHRADHVDYYIPRKLPTFGHVPVILVEAHPNDDERVLVRRLIDDPSRAMPEFKEQVPKLLRSQGFRKMKPAEVKELLGNPLQQIIDLKKHPYSVTVRGEDDPHYQAFIGQGYKEVARRPGVYSTEDAVEAVAMGYEVGVGTGNFLAKTITLKPGDDVRKRLQQYRQDVRYRGRLLFHAKKSGSKNPAKIKSEGIPADLDQGARGLYQAGSGLMTRTKLAAALALARQSAKEHSRTMLNAFDMAAGFHDIGSKNPSQGGRKMKTNPNGRVYAPTAKIRSKLAIAHALNKADVGPFDVASSVWGSFFRYKGPREQSVQDILDYYRGEYTVGEVETAILKLKRIGLIKMIKEASNPKRPFPTRMGTIYRIIPRRGKPGEDYGPFFSKKEAMDFMTRHGLDKRLYWVSGKRVTMNPSSLVCPSCGGRFPDGTTGSGKCDGCGALVRINA